MIPHSKDIRDRPIILMERAIPLGQHRLITVNFMIDSLIISIPIAAHTAIPQPLIFFPKLTPGILLPSTGAADQIPTRCPSIFFLDLIIQKFYYFITASFQIEIPGQVSHFLAFLTPKKISERFSLLGVKMLILRLLLQNIFLRYSHVSPLKVFEVCARFIVLEFFIIFFIILKITNNLIFQRWYIALSKLFGIFVRRLAGVVGPISGDH